MPPRPRRRGISGSRRCAGGRGVGVGVLLLAQQGALGAGPPAVELTALVCWSFERSNATYGYRRIHAELTRRGVTVGADVVRDIAREQGLVACQPRPFRTTTVPGDGTGAPDLLGRDFTADAPGTRLVGDITYLATWEGFAYLATVIDCYSKTVIGWAVARVIALSCSRWSRG